MDDLTNEEFKLLRDLLHGVTGIALSPNKRELLRSRLARRLRALGLPRYGDYYRYLRERDPQGRELNEMVNAMTTNKTSFFREPYQFDWLVREVFPAMKLRARAGGAKRVRVWSAGCSTGAEPYTVAMLLRETFETGWELAILGSDIDTEVLATAAAGEFEGPQLEGLDDRALSRHFLRGRGESEGRYRVRPEVRNLVTFRRINLVEPFGLTGKFDFILCRNVSIYFDRETQAKVFAGLAAQLEPGGYLLVGHSECLTGLDLPLTALKGNVYQRPASPAAATAWGTVGVGAAETARAEAELVARLAGSSAVCVYDPGASLGGLAHLSAGPAGGEALSLLVDKLRGLGAAMARLEAKVVAPDGAALEAVRRRLSTLGVKLVQDRLAAAAEVRFLPAMGRVRLSALQGTP